MKKNLRKALFGSLMLMGAVVLQSCGDDNDSDIKFDKVPSSVQSAFDKKYPSFKPTEWEQRQNFYVADFKESTHDAEAWFDAQGVWQLTETDVPFNQLPKEVLTAFQASKYAKWKVEDVDKIEKVNVEVFYIIEVEQANVDVDLYYSASGLLIKEVVDVEQDNNDDNDIHTPDPTIPAAIADFIQKNYPQARIADWDVEKTGIEVDIVHANIAKELRFTTANVWVSTSWEVFPANLPQAIHAKLASTYPNTAIDDAEFFETPAGKYYLIELDAEPHDIVLKFTEAGEIIK